MDGLSYKIGGIFTSFFSNVTNKSMFTYLRMSSPDLFLQSITLMMMIAMSVMPATAAITIHSVLFLSSPPATCAATSGPLGAEVEVRAVKQSQKM